MLWIERTVAEKILEELSDDDVGITQQELVKKYREYVNAHLQKAGALAAVYDDPTDN